MEKKDDIGWSDYLSDLNSCMKDVSGTISYSDKYSIEYVDMSDYIIPKSVRYVCKEGHFSNNYICHMCGSVAEFRLFKMCCGLEYDVQSVCINCHKKLSETDKSYIKFLDWKKIKDIEKQEEERKAKEEELELKRKEEAKEQAIKKQADLESDYLMLALGTIFFGLLSVVLTVAIIIGMNDIQIVVVSAVILAMSICIFLMFLNGFIEKGKEIDKAGFDLAIQKEINTESNFEAVCF